MREPTRLLALRHGQTAWNADQRIQGQLDVALNGVGRWQAAQLAQAVARQLDQEAHQHADQPGQPALAAIYSSDLQRALATAEALSAATGTPVTTDPSLRERSFGSFQGETFAQIAARLPADAERWRRRDPDFSPGGGESLNAFAARVVPAVARLAALHAGEQIAVVAHGGVLDCLYRAACGVAVQAPRSWQLGNATINRLLFTGEGFTLVGWNDDAHLAGQPGGGVDTAAADAPR